MEDGNNRDHMGQEVYGGAINSGKVSIKLSFAEVTSDSALL